MIMKDEEDWLPLCLKHVRDLVDEIIIVDTGSKDRSVEIAMSFGARVLHHPWVDDFAKVRNFSLQHATCDWVLVLDADEIILKSDHVKIRSLMKHEEHCYLLTQRHYTNDVRLSGFEPCVGQYPEREVGCAGYFESALGRLFPNYRGIHYRGAVHELIEFCLNEIADIKLVDPKVLLHHYGHTNKVKDKKDKSKLYTPLGEKKVSNESRGWKEWFELAVEHNNNRRIEDSIVAFEESLKLKKDYLPTWINYGYVLCEAGKLKEAREVLLVALRIDPRSEEAYCNLGVVELRAQCFDKAEKYFRSAVRIKPNYINAWRNLSISLASTKRYSESVLVLLRILGMLPNDYQTLMSLGSLYLHAGDSSEALKYFSKLYEKSPRNTDLVIMISQAIKNSGDAVNSLRFLTKHIKSHGQNLDSVDLSMLRKTLDRESVELFLS